MHTLLMIGVLVLSYIVGAIPFGLLIVRLRTGQDIRKVESGRTGGTNAMRAAGFWAGFATAALDLFKGAVGVWLAQWLAPENPWWAILAGAAAVVGHNYSIFLAERKPDGGWRLRGGAGGATTVGGAMGLWVPSLFIIVPLAGLVLFGIGYASVATMSAALLATLIFAVRAALGYSPWAYAAYGLLTEVLLVIALLPNIRRLRQGTERRVGWRAKSKPTTG